MTEIGKNSFLATPGSRILLVGWAPTAGSADSMSELTPLPTIPRTVEELRSCLIERCGVSADAIDTPPAPASPEDLYNSIVRTARGVSGSGAFGLVYIGHGVKDANGRTLFLATGSTRSLVRSYPESQALSFRRIAAAIRQHCRALRGLVVLDCCYSGLASPLPFAESSILFSSSSDTRISYAPEGSEHTAFSGELIRLLRADGARVGLTIADLAADLDSSCRDAGRPPVLHTLGKSALLRVTGQPPPATADGVRASAPPSEATVQPLCPYPGLRGFESADKWCFYGRESDTERLINDVSNGLFHSGPVVLVGKAGAGKSSLLRAGLLDAIDHGALGAGESDRWPRILMTPQDAPLAQLYRSLRALTSEHTLGVRVPYSTTESIQDELFVGLDSEVSEAVKTAVRTVRAVLAAYAQSKKLTKPRLILVIDQMEEVFTLSLPSEWETFLHVLRELCVYVDDRTSTPPALVVLGIRDDHYVRLAEARKDLPGLSHPSFLLNLDPDGLLRAIREPAALADVIVADDLLDRLTARMSVDGELGETPQTAAELLPQLSHALRQTWHIAQQRRPGSIGALTSEDFDAAGGLDGAVARTGKAVLAQADEDGQAAIRRLFLRLLTVGSSDVPTRRRLSNTEAEAIVGPGLLADLLHADLLTQREDSVEISQETLGNSWPELSEWIAQERSAVLVQIGLEQEAVKWVQWRERERSGPKTRLTRIMRSTKQLVLSGYLLTGANLIEAETWDSDPDHHARLNEQQGEFLRASIRRGRRNRRAFWSTVASLALFLTGAFVSLSIATYEADQRSRQAWLANGRALVAEAAAIANTDPRTALLLDVQATEMGDSSIVDVADNSLRDILTHTHYAGTIPSQQNSPVVGVAISSDGNTLAAVTDVGTLELWNWNASPPVLESTRQVGHGGALLAVAFSPVANLLAIAGADQQIVLWNTDDPSAPRELGRLSTQGGSITSLAFSGNGDVLASATGNGVNNGVVELWETSLPQSGKPRAVINAPLGSLNAVAVSADGREVAAAGTNGVTGVWRIVNPSDPVPISFLPNNQIRINTLAFSPNGPYLAAGAGDGTTTLWNLTIPSSAPSSVPIALVGHVGPVLAAAFSRDGSTLTAAGNDGSTITWNVSNPAHPLQEAVLQGADGADDSVVFSDDGETVLTGQADGAITKWTMHTAGLAQPYLKLEDPHQATAALGFSPDGRLLAAAGSGHVMLWDLSTSPKPTQLPVDLTEPGTITSIAFSPDGRQAAVGFATPDAPLASSIGLWDVANASRPIREATLNTQHGDVSAVEYTPNGHALAAASGDGTVQLWNVAGYTPSSPPPPDFPSVRDPSGPLTSLAISSDSHLLAAGVSQTDTHASDSDTAVWNIADPQTPKLVKILTDHTKSSLSVAFSPGASVLAGAGAEGRTYLWNLKALPTITVGSRPLPLLNSLSFSPSGRYLAGTSGAGAVAIYDLNSAGSPNSITTLSLSSGQDAVAFSPTNENILATSTQDGTTALWSLSNILEADSNPSSTACSLTGSSMTSKVWQRYVSFMPYRSTCS